MLDRQMTFLHLPDANYRQAFLEMLADYAAAGEQAQHKAVRHLARRDFPAYVRWLESQASGAGVTPGWVPNTAYWLILGREIVGEANLRHRLNASLQIEGGHIGYRIRPSRRRQGHGTRILALTLEAAQARGLRQILVTCDRDNVGSRRIIENNGGVYKAETRSPASGKWVLQYWIEL